MTPDEVYELAIQKIHDTGMIVHPKHSSRTDGVLVILCAFFGQRGVAAVSISGLEMPKNAEAKAINDLLEGRVSMAFNALRTRVLAEIGPGGRIEGAS